MVPVVYPVGYPVIDSIMKTIFAKESGVKRLETRAYLLDYPYKIGVILAVRIYSNKITCYFRIQGPFQIRDFKVIRPCRSIVFYLIPARTGGGRPQKVCYPAGVSGKGVPRPFSLRRGPYNTLLSNLEGCQGCTALFVRPFRRIGLRYSRRPLLIRSKYTELYF